MSGFEGFYAVGGTLPLDAPSYVERKADRDLLSALLRRDYCYILDSRQKGKSSLMARAVRRLREAGVATSVLDLQGRGSNLTAEQWYAGLLVRLGQDLHLATPLLEHWKKGQMYGPLERFLQCVSAVVLPNVDNLVVFVDEIDFVRSLPFPVDEFFGGIRELYNRRANEEAYRNITFCLLGVATPGELIQDIRITPFNVGVRIELTDFTLEEAAPLAAGLESPTRNGKSLLSRIMYWTGGHPYLTQRLCSEVASEPSMTQPKHIDLLVERIFFGRRSKETEPNLNDVSRRVLESIPEGFEKEEYLAQVLGLYEKLRLRKSSVKDDSTDPIVNALNLSGLTKGVDGYLWVRNRLYFRVFDREWIRSSLPDAELRRQRDSARRATLKTSLVSGAIILALGTLAWNNTSLARNLNIEARKLDAQLKETARTNTRLRSSNEALKQQTRWANLNLEEASHQRALALAARARADESSEARLVALQLASQNLDKAKAQEKLARIAAAGEKLQSQEARTRLRESLKLRYVATMQSIQQEAEVGNSRRVVELLEEAKGLPDKGFEWYYWDQQLHQEALNIPAIGSPTTCLAFSPNGSILAAAFENGVIMLQSLGGTRASIRAATKEPIYQLRFSRSGKQFLTVGPSDVKIWSSSTGACLHRFKAESADWLDESTVVLIAGNGSKLSSLEVRSTSSEKLIFSLRTEATGCVADSEGKWVAAWGSEAKVFSWDGAKLALAKPMPLKSGLVRGASFSGKPGQLLVSFDDYLPGNVSKTVVYDCPSGTFKYVEGSLPPLDANYGYGSTGAILVQTRNEARLYAANSGLISQKFHNPVGGVESAMTSGDATKIGVAGRNGDVRIYDSESGRCLRIYLGSTQLSCLALSPNGALVASGMLNGSVLVWNTHLEEESGHRASTAELIALGEKPRDLGHGELKYCDIPKEALEALGLQYGSAEEIPGKNRLIITGSPQGDAWLYDTTAKTSKGRLLHLGKQANFSFMTSHDGTRFLAIDNTFGGDYAAVGWLFDTETGSRLAEVRLPQGRSRALKFSPKDKYLYATIQDAKFENTLYLFGGRNGRLIHTAPTIWSHEFLKNDTRLLIEGRLSEIGRRSYSIIALSETIPALFKPLLEPGFSSGSQLVSPNESKYLGCSGSEFLCSSIESGSKVWSVPNIWASVQALWSPNSSYVACQEEHCVRVLDARDGKVVASLGVAAQRPEVMVWSSDGSHLATLSREKDTITIWKVSGGRLIQTLAGHRDRVRGGRFYNNDGRFASLSADESLRLWEIASGKELLKLQSHAYQGNIRTSESNLLLDPVGMKFSDGWNIWEATPQSVTKPGLRPQFQTELLDALKNEEIGRAESALGYCLLYPEEKDERTGNARAVPIQKPNLRLHSRFFKKLSQSAPTRVYGASFLAGLVPRVLSTYHFGEGSQFELRAASQAYLAYCCETIGDKTGAIEAYKPLLAEVLAKKVGFGAILSARFTDEPELNKQAASIYKEADAKERANDSRSSQMQFLGPRFNWEYGALLYRSKQYEEARQELEGATQYLSSSIPYELPSFYYLLMAELKTGNLSRAKSLAIDISQARKNFRNFTSSEEADALEKEAKSLLVAAGIDSD